MSATYGVDEVAALLGVASWTVRQAIDRGDCPIMFLRVGRRLVAPKGPANAVLGIDTAPERDEGPSTQPGPPTMSTASTVAASHSEGGHHDCTRR